MNSKFYAPFFLSAISSAYFSHKNRQSVTREIHPAKRNNFKGSLRFCMAFIAFFCLGLSKTFAQPATSVPIVKYAINNYASISQAICDTCPVYLGKPLQKNRPVPFPPVSAFDALTGVDLNVIPGISAPNFIGGGSPEIKGLVKSIAGMTDLYAEKVRKTDILYFRTGAQGVAVSNSGKIFTTSNTFLPGANFGAVTASKGFFSFKSSPERLPSFNSRSLEAFAESPKKMIFEDEEIANTNQEIAYFALHPANETIVYAAFKNIKNNTKILARKNTAGTWHQLDWDIPNGLAEGVWGSLAVDLQGNLYVADSMHHVIVKVTFDGDGKAASWTIIAGQMDKPGFVNDEDALDARFNHPGGICVDSKGNIYVGDAGNNVIRKIDEDGVITFAGNKNGEKGFKDDDSWSDAKFNGPTALAYNEKFKTLYVVDYGNKLIREIDEEQKVTTLAGNAGSLDPREPVRFAQTVYYIFALLNSDPDEAKFDDPTGIAIDPSGLGVYVSDGKYIKYVNTFQALFEVTASYRSPDSKNPLYGLPVLPPGILMNPHNGSFFGVPVTTWEPTTYVITATNSTGRSIINGFISFEVVDCPSVADTVRDNRTISPKQLPYTWNGKVLTSGGQANVKLQSSGGCDSVVLLTLTVRPEFNYNCDPYTLTKGKQIVPILPVTSGSGLESFSVSPALPSGLTLNTQTGVISGTPLTYATSQLFPALGPKTPQQYAAPWTLKADLGADITQVQILDCSQRAIFENNSPFKSLTGSAGQGIGTPGAYTDFSGLGPIKMSTNTAYSVQLKNTLFNDAIYRLKGIQNYMNSFAVYIDYNRDGDFADTGERVYISASPQAEAHTEIFNLNIPVTATSGVTKMRIYCVEAPTWTSYYSFIGANGLPYPINRTTEQALSFYPFFTDIENLGRPNDGELAFRANNLDHGEFEDYNIEIENPFTQSYVVKGRNSVDSAQAIVKISVNDSTASSTNGTICSTELPYKWNGLTFTQSGSQTATLKNRFGADSLATLNLLVKQATSSEVNVAFCGPYTYNGKVYTESGLYVVKLTNAAGCDNLILFNFRQKATSSETSSVVLPSAIPYTWNGLTFTTAGTKSAILKNAEGCDSTATLVLRVMYNVYYPATNALEVNKPVQAITPQIEGNYSINWNHVNEGYTISPTLPAGLQLNPLTGVISGTPTELSPMKTYTITLKQDGAQPTTLNLAVGMSTVSTTTVDNCGPYSWNGKVYDKAGSFSATLTNQYGLDSVANLVLAIRNPSTTILPFFVNQSELPLTWNGISITGEGSKTVTLANAVGCDSTVTINVTIGPKVLYQSPIVLKPNQLMAPIAPQNNGGLIPSSNGIVSTLFQTSYLSPVSIAVDTLGNNYLSDELRGNVYRVTKRGIVSKVDGFDATQALLAVDKAGNIYAADRRSNRILKKDITGAVTVLATAGSPNGIAVDSVGNVYFSEGQFHRIRKISNTGVVSTLAGGTTAGSADGNAATARFNMPSGLTVDKAGNVFVADLLNNKIRKITAAGDVTSFAGNGSATSTDGVSNNAGFNAPIDIAADNYGNKYVVDNGSSKIRKIDAAGIVSTLAGTTTGYQNGAGSQAKFKLPVAITTDSRGQVYVADKANGAIRQINAINYSIQPALQTGLQFNDATGVISGTPANALVQPATYVVQVFNKAGADSVKIAVAVCVNSTPTSFTLDTCNQYLWIDSIYTVSTTQTRTLRNRGGCDSVVTMRLIIRKGSEGPTTTATACGSYVWKEQTYNKTGIYTRIYPNAVGCDSIVYLNLTIKNLSYNQRSVDLNQSDLPYIWRGKIFTAPGTQTIVLQNSVGCDSIISMTVRISNLLPNISYAIKDPTFYWEKKIEVPLAMTNTGTAIPAAKLGERDTLINFSNRTNSSLAAGTYVDHMVKGPDGNYYATVVNSNRIFTLNKSGVWTVFAGSPDGGTADGSKSTAKFQQPRGLAFDAVGNMYVGSYTLPASIRKITPDGSVSTLNILPLLYAVNALAVDAKNNLIIQSQGIITKLNLATNQSEQMKPDYSPYFGTGELDMKTDSKGNIYILPNTEGKVVKITPAGQISGIGTNPSTYQTFKPGNGPDAEIPPSISGMAIDPTNDNLYLMAFGQILRVDTSENVSAVSGRWFGQWADQIIGVDSGKVSVVDNYSGGVLYKVNTYGIGSLPFIDNYGASGYTPETVNYRDFDKRIRLDSNGAILGTPRGTYTTSGNPVARNTATSYRIVAANQYGTSSTPMVITTKSLTNISETVVTKTVPYIWRGRSFSASTDTATYLVTNKTLANDTLYTLHLVLEGNPEPVITVTRDCVAGQVTLKANSAAKNAIGFDGSNVGLIKYRQDGGSLSYFSQNTFIKPDNSYGFNPSSAYEVWIKPTSVSGTQYILAKDSVKSHEAFTGLSVQNGKLVYELTKAGTTATLKLSSATSIVPNVWTHVAASYYDSAMHIFINGKLEDTLKTGDRFFPTSYYDAVGQANRYPDFTLAGLGRQSVFTGEMDELRVWSTVRKEAAVKATMNIPVDPTSAGLALYYRFDGDLSQGAIDISNSNRSVQFLKPAAGVNPSTAPIDFSSYKWMPGGATSKTIIVNPVSSTVYTLTVTDYKASTGSASTTVAPLVKPAKVNCWDDYQMNAATCTWVNVGIQPARPATLCYQTATFNTNTCQWVVTGTQVSAGTNGTLTICEGTTVTAAQLFAALKGSPKPGGTWSPAFGGAGTYTYTVAASGTCAGGNATAAVTVNAVEKIIDAGCYSGTISRSYNAATNRTTFTYDICANNCAKGLGYIAFITQTNVAVVSPANGSAYKTTANSYKVSVPVGSDKGKPIYGIKFEVSGNSDGIKKSGECDKFVFTLSGNITKEAVMVRFKAANEIIDANAQCPPISVALIALAGHSTVRVEEGTPQLAIKAYPNPYRDKVKFEISSPEAGQGSLEVFNLAGQKIKSVYQGRIIKGTQTFELTVPQGLRTTLVYRLTVNGKLIMGKLVNAGDY